MDSTLVNPEIMKEIVERCSVPADAIEDVFKVTALQMGTMIESTMYPNRYKHTAVFSLAPSVNLQRLASSLAKLVSLNSILRTRIIDTSSQGLLQVVLREEHQTAYNSQTIEHFLREEQALPMGLGKPLLRSTFVDGKLVLTTHHAIRDETSTALMLSDLDRLYHSQEPELHVPFKDFVDFCHSVEECESRAFWTESFKGESAIFPIPRQGESRLSKPFERQHKEIPLPTTVSQAQLPAYVELAWALTTSVYANAHAIAFGLVFSGRTPSFKSTIGPTAAVVPVQVVVDPSLTIRALLKERIAARRRLLNHAALHYGLANIRRVSYDAEVAAGFETVLNIIPRAQLMADTGVLRMEKAFEVDVQFAISLNCFLHDTTVSIEADFDPVTLEASQMQRVLRQFVFTLSWLLNTPMNTTVDQFPILNPDDLSEILDWNQNVPESVEECLHDLFKARAQQQPSAQAVDAPDGTATYSELDEMSDRLASHLRLRGVGPENKVPLLFGKTIWAVVSLLAILKAGGVCVPMDPSHPPQRIWDIILRCNGSVVLTSVDTEKMIASMPPSIFEHFTVSAESIKALSNSTRSLPEELPAPTNAAYILFTSGSTGIPKGVVLEHRNLASTLIHYGRRVGWEADGGCRMLQFSSFVWDTHTLEVFGTLLWGGCICIPSESQRADLESFIDEKAVEWAILTPTVIRTLDAHSPQVATLKTIVSCGEPVDKFAVRHWSPSHRFINEYGPCEVSGRCTLTELAPDSPFPESIGKPVDCAVWIVSLQDPSKLAPIGTPGEIVVEGPGVARGYLDDEALTTASFVTQPPWLPPGQKPRRKCRYYRTGDTAKYNADGSMTFTGRQDGQVKIRGQRFELGEVERALGRAPGVREAVVSIQPWRENSKTLTAVLVLADAELQVTTEKALRQVSVPKDYDLVQRLKEIREYLASCLPSYMVPTTWLVVEGMPLTTSGKLDRALVIAWLKSQDLEAARNALQSSSTLVLTAPASDHERILQSVWASVLSIRKQEIGRESNFLTLGGDSITAMRATNLCRKKGLLVPLQAMIQSSSLAATTEHCESVSLAPKQAPPQPVDTPVTESIQIEGFVDSDIEAVTEATDAQASMVALGELEPQALILKTGVEFRPAVEKSRIENACSQVLQHHEILRTIFVHKGPKLYQVVLKRPMGTQILPDDGSDDQHDDDILPRFYVASDDQHCYRLRLEIHHAFYDAVSLGLLWKDFAAACAGRELSSGSSFVEWARQMARLDQSQAKQFWRKALKGSRLTYLAPPGKNPGSLKRVEIRIALRSLSVPGITTANLLKAAWALVMGLEAGTQDVVFAELLANRYSPSNDIDHENVRGPCLNTNPVRAQFDSNMTFVAVAARLQEQSLAAAPFAYLGYRTIQKDCTEWPLSSLFGSVVNFQSPEAVGNEEIDLGNLTKARFMAPVASVPSRSSALWVIARPTSDELIVTFNFSSTAFTEEKVQGLAAQVRQLLEGKPTDISPWISESRPCSLSLIAEKLPPTSSSTTQLCARQDPGEHDEIPMSVRLEVQEAWKAVGLETKGDYASLFECGGDTVTAMLLSRQYRHNLGVGDVLAYPSQEAQARLLVNVGK
ncbi:nonribosomal peptide [Colletotrichum truncatum]|uniref:Nonribosomal peptide n=1 Tax=Colletotrichum truncatum TaxID=5467 RepID=A0ACC3Z374_COLTU|nr:nonribosomal peptide [Colletotrichum truncatum]KAF6793176.1 nonribosomal peptide [Colletotrichum truncatum]